MILNVDEKNDDINKRLNDEIKILREKLKTISDEISSIKVIQGWSFSINVLASANPNTMEKIFSSPRENISDISTPPKDKAISALWGPLVVVRLEQSSSKYWSKLKPTLELL